MQPIEANKNYLPISGRLKIPATTKPDAPYRFILQSQARTLEYIEIVLPQTGVLQDLGVRILGNEGVLYPAGGSRGDSNFTDAKDSYGAMPTSGHDLILPFNRKMLGPPYTITFEFYNDGAGAVSVNLFVITSEEKNRMLATENKKKEAATNGV
jgi:hypothetical protein